MNPWEAVSMTVDRKQQYILYFTLFQVLLGFGIIIPILPFYVGELGGTAVHVGLMITVWAGAQFITSPLWGSLSDRIGRRPVLLIGLVGYAIAFGAMAFVTNIWSALLFRFLGGVLSAATVPTAQAFVADTSTGEERGNRMAAMAVSMNMGFIGGPMIGGLLELLGLGYREIFMVSGLFAVLTWVVAFIFLPEPQRRHARAVPGKSFSGLQAVGMAMRGPEALLFLLAFASTFGGSSMFSMLGLFIHSRLGGGTELLAIGFTYQAICSVFFQSVLVSKLGRRFREESIVSTALLAGILGFGVLIFAPNFPWIIVGLTGVSFAFSIIRPTVAGLVSKRTRLEQGMTMGMQTSFDALGRTVAPMLAGSLFLWHDWAPFAMALGMYMTFFVVTQIAWRKVPPAPSIG
jgi:DHA1 family multidrug resistance protein-like MFS transporter